MSSNIPARRLLVISDSPVYKEKDGYVAFEPVVRELEALAPLFEEIVWLGCKTREKKYAMRSPNKTSAIKIIGMPGVLHKFNFIRMLAAYPLFICYVLKFSSRATHIHTRGPSHPALLGILFSMMTPGRLYWHKYAGNWIGENLALTYRLQKSLLKLARKKYVKVTVNGVWPGNPQQILSFENPCLYESELQFAKAKAAEKNFTGKLSVVFVGNLTRAKGILELIEAVLSEDLNDRFENIYVAGDGDLYDHIKSITDRQGKRRIHVLGHQNRQQVNKLYELSHVVILPSQSEGFPKVIAEGAAYGCIPVVTDVSSISQCIHQGQNGYLLPHNSSQQILAALNSLATNASLKAVSNEAQKIATNFTYERFVSRIKKEVFDLELYS